MLRNLQLCTRRSICENYCIKSFKAVEKRENNNSKIDCNLWSHHFSEHFSATKLYLCRTDLHPRHVFLLEDKVKARAFFCTYRFCNMEIFSAKIWPRVVFGAISFHFTRIFQLAEKLRFLTQNSCFPR